MNARTIPAALAVLLLMALPALAAGELLTAPEPGESHRFGHSMAVDGSVHLAGPFVGPVVVAGAPYDEDGAAWVRYLLSNGTEAWQKLTSPNSKKYGDFGWSVGVSGDRVVVGGTLRVVVFRHKYGSFVFEADLRPQGASISQDYGKAVALDGDTVVVGDGKQGLVYVFVRGESGWVEEQRLDSGADRAYRFGRSVDIDGDRMIVGTNASAAYVFAREDGVWTREGVLEGTGVESADDFGLAVAISGETAVVGAPTDEHVARYAGSAYVFRYEGDAWTEKQHLVASDAKYGARFGNAVAADGPVILVGAHREELPTAWYGGAVYEFALSGDTWKERRKVTSPTASGGDEFGNAVALSGNVAVGGSFLDNAITPGGDVLDSGTAYLWPVDKVLDPAVVGFGDSVSVACDTAVVGSVGAKKAVVYRRHGAAWRETSTLTMDAEGFGRSVAVDGDRLVVVATWGAWTFVRSGDTWSVEQVLTDPDGSPYGSGVALSADTLAIAGHSIPRDSPVVWLFRHDGRSWVPDGDVSPPSNVETGGFGASLALRGDTLVVGSRQADHYGRSTGAAYVHERIAGVWTPTKVLLSPDTTKSLFFGSTVSVGEDRILVGSVGKACLYERRDGPWSLSATLLPAKGVAPLVFGNSAALSGDTAVVSRIDGPHVATVFTPDGTTWIAREELEAVDAGHAMREPESLAFCGNSLLVHDSEHNVMLAFHGVGARIPPIDFDYPHVAVSTTGVSFTGRYVRTGGLRPPFTLTLTGDFPITGGIDPETGAVDGVYIDPGDY
ncbi:MAG: hypothetical protein ABFS86_08935, partial [Planctomycetota bacterium]